MLPSCICSRNGFKITQKVGHFKPSIPSPTDKNREADQVAHLRELADINLDLISRKRLNFIISEGRKDHQRIKDET